MRITESQLRRIIREELLSEKTLGQVTDIRPVPIDPADDEMMIGNFTFSPGRKDVTTRRRDIKRSWNQNADHRFFQDPNKILVIHTLGLVSGRVKLGNYFPPEDINPKLFEAAVKAGLVENDPEKRGEFISGGNLFKSIAPRIPKDLIQIPGIQIPNRNELSCEAMPRGNDPELKYLEWSVFAKGVRRGRNRRNQAFFTFKKYRMTWASQDDSHTEHLNMATPEDLKFYASSGLPKRPAAYLRVDQAPIDEEDSQFLGEVVIDNWIVDTYYGPKEDAGLAGILGLKFEIL